MIGILLRLDKCISYNGERFFEEDEAENNSSLLGYSSYSCPENKISAEDLRVQNNEARRVELMGGSDHYF